ncbi:Na+/H+ antiporter subunit E [Sinisalibacter aestuarii]|uniref:Na+/H+ antiporter subunit E n=1 Tax=Sinisalibacter aestuarii TaxID=2949426 RepID=A0ABQ5LSF3_9RHOB|nr:Na+/H+ antiporter subunit E [Sinisalibacter aestuarii]GKY87340.1 Na+/H+ antiporter subunit E [Sinisalibacter aestuarii]
MARSVDSAKLFGLLLLFWLLLNGSVAPGTIGVGAVVAALIVVFFGGSLSFLSGHRLTPDALIATLFYLGYFLRELVRANLAMARIVLSPSLPIRPAIVKLRTRLTDPVARLLLANSITLTPGTLSVELKGEWLYVHWVSATTTDPEEATREIVSGFEKYLEVMYG